MDAYSLIVFAVPGVATVIGCIVFLSCARLVLPLVFEPRTEMALPHVEDVSKPLSRNPIIAFCQVLTMPLTRMRETVGLDAMAYAAFGRTLMLVCFLWIVLSFAILMPLYCPGDTWKEAVQESKKNFAPLIRCSVSNIEDGDDSPKYIATVVCTWIFSLLLIAGLVANLIFIQRQKVKHLRHRRPGRYYTCIVNEIPAEKRDAGSIRSFYESEGYSVADVNTVRLLGDHFYSEEAEYRDVWRKLEIAKMDEEDTDELQWTRLPPPECFSEVPAVEHYSSEAECLKSSLTEYQENYYNHEAHSVAFVTFNSLTDASDAYRDLYAGRIDLETKDLGWRTEPAPEPRDIIWKSLENKAANNLCEHYASKVFLWVGTFIVIIVWIIPILSVQAVKVVFTESDNYGMNLVADFLPPLLLVILNLLGTLVLSLIASAAGLVTRSERQHEGMWQNFFFLMIDSFLITFVFGSAVTGAAYSGGATHTWDDLWSHDPLSLLGESMPRYASFYFLYILSQAFYGIVPFIAFPFSFIYYLLARAWNLKGRLFEAATDPGPPAYALCYAYDAFIFSITFCFGILAPITFIAGFLFVFISHMSVKYSLLYNFRSEFQVEGALVLPASGQVLCGNLFGQIGVLAVLFVRGAWVGFALVPLIILTAILMVALRCCGFETLYDQGLEPDLAAEFDAELEGGYGASAKQAHHREMALEGAKHGLWRQPLARGSLDHPYPDKFFWQNVVDGQELLEYEDESLLLDSARFEEDGTTFDDNAPSSVTDADDAIFEESVELSETDEESSYVGSRPGSSARELRVPLVQLHV